MTNAHSRQKTTAVIGGGVIGVTSAIHLLRAGFKVVLIERGGIAEGASFGNAGCLNPSSIIPMSMPGILWSVPKWLLDPLGPLAVRWTYLPRSLPWLTRFVRLGSLDDVRGRVKALASLLALGVDGMERLAKAAGVTDLIARTGVLNIYRSRDNFLNDGLSWQLRRENGIPFETMEEKELRALAPQIAPDFKYGVLLPGNAFIRNPHRFLLALAAMFSREGGSVIRANVSKIDADGRNVLLRCDTGEDIQVDKVVVAAGAYSKNFVHELGDWLPLETERGYHAMIANPEVAPALPIMNVEDKFYATPMETGLRIAGTVEIAGLTRAPDWRRARILLDLGKRTFPGLAVQGESERLSVWMGHRPSLPDSLPAIGYSSCSRDVVYAFGHGHVGMTAAAKTANIVVDLLLGRTPQIDIQPFRPGRFSIRSA